MQFSQFTVDVRVAEYLRLETGKLVKIDENGEMEWQVDESLSCESHVTFHRVSLREKTIQYSGNPALLACTNNAFGTDCIIKSVHSILDFLDEHFSKLLDIEHTQLFNRSADSLKLHTVSRIDFNKNIMLASQEQVSTALDVLSITNRRGFDVSQITKNGITTTYWNKDGRHLEGKAYDKITQVNNVIMRKFNSTLELDKRRHRYPEIETTAANSIFNTLPYTHDELNALKGILRLEVKIGGKYIHKHCKIAYEGRHAEDKRKHLNADNYRYWFNYTPKILNNIFDEYFKPFIKETKIKTMSKLLTELKQITKNDQAEQAYSTFCKIKTEGYKSVCNRMKENQRATWYRHIKLLKQVGLNHQTIQSGVFYVNSNKVVRIDFSNHVKSFAQCKMAA